jgi:hypothetical protein
MIERPAPEDYVPYFIGYVSLVPEGDVLTTLETQIKSTVDLLVANGEEKALYRYQPNKWSIKEVVGHLSDTERVLTCRALRFSRGDPTELPGFEQDDYVENGSFDRRSLSDLLAELKAIRRATVALFGSLDQESLQRSGIAGGNRLTVAAIASIVAGHELHHARILKERYGVTA